MALLEDVFKGGFSSILIGVGVALLVAEAQAERTAGPSPTAESAAEAGASRIITPS